MNKSKTSKVRYHQLTPKEHEKFENSGDESSNQEFYESSDNNVTSKQIFNKKTFDKLMDRITALENKNEELEYNARRSQYSQNKTSSKNRLAKTNGASNSRPSKEKDLDKKHKIHKKLYTKYQESSSERSSSEYESDEICFVLFFFLKITKIPILFYLTFFISKDKNASSTINVSNSQSATSLIPKPPPGKSQYTKLYLKLNLDRVIYNSYRVRN